MKNTNNGIYYTILAILLILSSGFYELDVIVAQSVDCGNVLENAVVVDYSSYYNDDFAPENLIDGNQNRSWSSSEGDEQPYVIFNLGNTFEIDQLQLNGYFQANDAAYEGDSVRGFRLEALVDEQWVTVISGESPLQDRLVSYSFSDTIVTDQVKIVFLSNYGGTAFEAAELIVCGQRATNSGSGSGGKENPENEPIFSEQGEFLPPQSNNWEFEGTRGQIVTVDFVSDIPHTLTLLDPQQNQIEGTNSFRSGGTHSWHGLTLPMDGTYTLIVSGYGSDQFGGEYSLSVWNGYVGQTIGQLQYGDNVQGVFSPTPPGYQRWTFEGRRDQRVTIEFISSIDHTLTFLDPSYQTLESTNSFRSGGTHTWHGIELPRDGTYTVVVSSYGSDPYGGPYELVVSEGYIGVTVGILTVGSVQEGVYDPAPPGYQRWTFAGVAGQTVSIAFNSDIEHTLTLLDPQYRELMSTNSFRSGRSYTWRGVELPITGTYTIVVSKYGSNPYGGPYTITVND